MKIRWRMLLEARYILSLNKRVKDLVPLVNVSEQTINHDIKTKMKEFDLELYNRVISVLNKC